MKAIWNGEILADSQKTIVVENNHYFPRDSIMDQYFEASSKKTFCPWKGEAKYLSLNINGSRNDDAAWYYPEPKDAAIEIKDYVAFWNGVEIKE